MRPMLAGTHDVAHAEKENMLSEMTPQPLLGQKVAEALRERASCVIAAAGLMSVITDEPCLANAVTNELLLLVFELVLTLNAPSEAWAKRAFKEKMLSMLLASAVRFGEIGLAHAEAEGKPLSRDCSLGGRSRARAPRSSSWS